jgi:hypothetical protein
MRQKSPRDAGVFDESPLVAIKPDWVVADAVAIEPVSAAQIPANREKNRVFRGKMVLCAGSGANKSPKFKGLEAKFPNTVTGKFLVRSGPESKKSGARFGGA